MSYGISSDYEYVEFQFDSLDATTQTTSSAAITDWPTFQLSKPMTNIAAVKLLECQVPFSYYVVTTENSAFTFYGQPDPITYPFEPTFTSTITIPTGNYNSTTLGTTLTTLLQAVMTANYPGDPWGTVTVTFSTLTGKYTINITGVEFQFFFGDVNFPAESNRGDNNPRLLLGFPAYASELVVGAGPVVAPNVALVTGPNYIYLNSKLLGPLAECWLPTGAAGGSGEANPQLAKISVNTNPGGVIDWQDPNPQKWFNLDNLFQLNSVDFYFTLGNSIAQLPLRFNGQGFSIKVGFLLKNRDHIDNQAGTLQQDRVVKRFRVG